MRKLFFPLLLLLLCIPLAHAKIGGTAAENATEVLGGGQTYTAPIVTGWFPIAVLALLTVLIIYTVVWAFAHAFHSAEFETYARSEMMQAFSNAVLIGFLVVLIGGATAFIGELMHGKVPCGDTMMEVKNLDSGIPFAKCKLADKGFQIATLQSRLADAADFNSLNLYISILGFPVFSGAYMSSWYKSVESARFMNSFATSSLIAINAQIFFLSYIQANALALMLPIGIVLRSIPFTRGIGSLFISLAIGFYFVLPFVFVVSDPGFIKMPPVAPKPDIPGSTFCYQTFSSAIAYVNYAGQAGGGSLGDESLSSMGTAFGRMYASLLIHPLAALFITIIMIRYMMYIFGEDAYDILRMVSKVV